MQALPPGAPDDERTLAAEVLPGILAQEAGPYRFPVEDANGGNSSFELSRDDVLYLVGLLNSSDIAIAKTELGALLNKLERPAVEGLTQRLFSALRRRNNEMIAAREDSLRAGYGAPQAQGARPRRQTRPADDRQVPSNYTTPRVKSETSLVPVQDGRRPRRRNGENSPQQGEEKPPKALSPAKYDELPPVFRRLTAPACRGSEEMARARVTLAAAAPSPDMTGNNACPLTIGGILSDRGESQTAVLASSGIARNASGPQVSEYLEQLLEAHEMETGLPASVTRRPHGLEDIDPTLRPAQRVTEDKAQEIFARLYRSGKEHRVRRKVYHELGLLVEQAKEAQTCTFEPRLPLAQYPGGSQPDGPIAERLYRDGMDRMRRREELSHNAPVPSFRPATLTESGYYSSGRPMLDGGGPGMGLSPRDTLGQDADDGDGLSRDLEPPHIRLFREHMERRTRQSQREEAQAEWRKHTFRPDISSSQASGPQILRSQSFSGLYRRDDDVEVRVQEEEDQYHMPEDDPVQVEPVRQHSKVQSESMGIQDVGEVSTARGSIPAVSPRTSSPRGVEAEREALTARSSPRQAPEAPAPPVTVVNCPSDGGQQSAAADPGSGGPPSVISVAGPSATSSPRTSLNPSQFSKPQSAVAPPQADNISREASASTAAGYPGSTRLLHSRQPSDMPAAPMAPLLSQNSAAGSQVVRKDSVGSQLASARDGAGTPGVPVGVGSMQRTPSMLGSPSAPLLYGAQTPQTMARMGSMSGGYGMMPSGSMTALGSMRSAQGLQQAPPPMMPRSSWPTQMAACGAEGMTAVPSNGSARLMTQIPSGARTVPMPMPGTPGTPGYPPQFQGQPMMTSVPSGVQFRTGSFR
mmetsp:Transcript_886/g.2030  ORF Transcript_886/g.2030 Transcript_886/m.2030 type:complete len:865 (+) Transcript_886:134-2728(+)